MATASKIEPKPVKQPPVRYVLELSEGEADFLLGLMGVIGGDTAKSPRKYALRIEGALSLAMGISCLSTDAVKLISDQGRPGSVYFANYDGSGTYRAKAPWQSSYSSLTPLPTFAGTHRRTIP